MNPGALPEIPVRYAYEVVLHPDELTVEDRLILHALGATWERNACAGSCCR